MHTNITRNNDNQLAFLFIPRDSIYLAIHATCHALITPIKKYVFVKQGSLHTDVRGYY